MSALSQPLFRHAYETRTCMPTYSAVTPSDVHTDPDSFPSFAEECSFGNGHRIHSTTKMTSNYALLTAAIIQNCYSIEQKLVCGHYL